MDVNTEKQTASPESYCVECDATPGNCAHGGPRYLSEVVYGRVAEGWKVPDGREREVWEELKARTYHTAPVMTRWPLERITEELDIRLFVTSKVLVLLTQCYEKNPERTTRLAQEIIRAADSGSMRNPAAWLAKLVAEGV